MGNIRSESPSILWVHRVIMAKCGNKHTDSNKE